MTGILKVPVILFNPGFIQDLIPSFTHQAVFALQVVGET
jgi:hypothetical protein